MIYTWNVCLCTRVFNVSFFRSLVRSFATFSIMFITMFYWGAFFFSLPLFAHCCCYYYCFKRNAAYQKQWTCVYNLNVIPFNRKGCGCVSVRLSFEEAKRIRKTIIYMLNWKLLLRRHWNKSCKTNRLSFVRCTVHGDLIGRIHRYWWMMEMSIAFNGTPSMQVPIISDLNWFSEMYIEWRNVRDDSAIAVALLTFGRELRNTWRMKSHLNLYSFAVRSPFHQCIR